MDKGPPLRSAVLGARYKVGTPSWYYAKRVSARSTRRPVQFNIPASLGLSSKPYRDEQESRRFDVLGPLIKDHYPVVPDNSRRNLLAAFDKRCNFYSDKRVDNSIIDASLALLDRITVGQQLDPIEWTPELFHKWNSQFPSAKRERHRKVYPLIAECTQKTFSNKEIFVKVEALMKRHDKDWAPRIIYQSSDLHNAMLGPVMQACTQRMFSLMGLSQGSCTMNYKGAYKASSQDLADYISRHGTPESVFIESDFTSNDMTQLRDVHILEVKWLRGLGAPVWLTSLMLHANSFAVSNRKHSFRGVVRNQLPTGAQSTTFRNSFWNCSINYAFVLKHGFHGDCMVLGDDNVTRLDNPWLSRLRCLRREYEHVCKLAGMRADVKVHRHLSECTFLSKQFIMTNRGYVMVPKFGKAIARFNARASVNEAVDDRSYLAGKALSYAYEFRSCPPISRCYFVRYLQLAPSGDVSLDGLGWNAKGAFLELGVSGIVASIAAVSHVASRDDMTRFYHWKYSLTALDVVSIVIGTLFGENDIDPILCERILEDFL